jgi:predicted nucleic acid-binding Zn ribbon protein
VRAPGPDGQDLEAGQEAGEAEDGGEAGEPLEPLDLIAEALTRAKADSISRDPSKVAQRPRVRSKPVAPVERRGPAPVGGLLREWIDDRGADVSVAVARITSCWDEVVGTAIAEHCRVDKLESGVLHVVAESTAWATNLRLMGPQILVEEGPTGRAGPRAKGHLRLS